MVRVSEIEAVVFDFGGVLTHRVKDVIAGWMASDGIDPASFSRTLKAWLGRDAGVGTPIHRLETGELSDAEFERILAAELCCLDGSAVEADGLLTRLFAGLRPDEAMYALAGDLRAAGVRVAVLSNSWGNTYPHERFSGLFDPVVISAEVGLRKPHAEIYRLTLQRLDVAAERAVFIDDAEPNVLGAQAVGMRALHHDDATTTRAALADLVPAIRQTEQETP